VSNSSLAEIEDLAGKLDENPRLLEARVVLGLIRDLRKHLGRDYSGPGWPRSQLPRVRPGADSRLPESRGRERDAARSKSDTSIFAAQRQEGEIGLIAWNGEKFIGLWCH